MVLTSPARIQFDGVSLVDELQRQKGIQLKLVATVQWKIALQQNTTEGGKLEVKQTLKPIIIKLED